MQSVVATPGVPCINAGADDYHLVLTSPAIDAGTQFQAPDEDIHGGARPAGAGYDIGAIEFAATPGGGLNARDDAATILEDAVASISLLANDSNPGGGPLTISILSGPSSGS